MEKCRSFLAIIIIGLSLAALGGTAVGQEAKLNDNVMRLVNRANMFLDEAETNMEKDRRMFAGPDGSTKVAHSEYNYIFKQKDYLGDFDPNHPVLVALKNRIDAVDAKIVAYLANKEKRDQDETWKTEGKVVTDNRYLKSNVDKAFSAAELESIYASRAAALADLKLLEEASTKLREFQQVNDRSSGLPSSVDELEKMLIMAKAFAKNDLKEVQSLTKSMMKKYDVSSLDELGVLMGQIINPGGQINNVSVSSNPSPFIGRSIEWIESFLPKVEDALAEAQKVSGETEKKLSAAKALTDFPDDSYDGSDIDKIKEQMMTALKGTVIKSSSEVLNIAVTGDWDEGIYSDTKLPYRKIRGTVLFADDDGDGASRYTSYTFISNKIDGDWKALKFKGFNTSLEGWAKPAKGSLGGGGGKGFIGSLVWIILVVVNIAAGLIAGQDLLKSKLPAIEKVTAPLQPFSALIGVAALGAGLLGFVLSVLSLHILAGIIPQLTAVALGLVLGREFIKEKATGKLKDQMEKHEASLQQVNTYSQMIGVAGLIAGVFYLLLGGALYVI